MANGRRCDRKRELFWRRMVRGHKGSGLTIRDWCRRHDLKEPAFYWWRTQLARRDAEAPAFVPVRISKENLTSADGSIEIVLAGDRRVRVSGRVDRQALADVLAVLNEAAREVSIGELESSTASTSNQWPASHAEAQRC